MSIKQAFGVNIILYRSMHSRRSFWAGCKHRRRNIILSLTYYIIAYNGRCFRHLGHTYTNKSDPHIVFSLISATHISRQKVNSVLSRIHGNNHVSLSPNVTCLTRWRLQNARSDVHPVTFTSSAELSCQIILRVLLYRLPIYLGEAFHTHGNIRTDDYLFPAKIHIYKTTIPYPHAYYSNPKAKQHISLNS